MVDHAARLLLQHVFVCPVPGHSGRIEGLEAEAVRPAAKDGLFHIPHLLRPIELVQLLEPPHADVAEWHLDGLELAGVVQTEEKDLLACRQVGTFHGADRAAEPAGQAQFGNGPADLGVHRCTQGVGYFPQHNGVAVRVAKQQQDQFHGHEAGFAAAAPAFGHQLVDSAGFDCPVRLPERRGQDLR